MARWTAGWSPRSRRPSSSAAELDVLLICRGGGSRTDLAWFDSEPIARAVATFPLPVAIGIGHEKDISALDFVGWSKKTPTPGTRAQGAHARRKIHAAKVQVKTITEQLEREAPAATDEEEEDE